jgi:hypothetical protein
MENENFLTSASVEELQSGLHRVDGGFVCIICGANFDDGVVYSHENRLLTSEFAAREHVQQQHGGTLGFLLGLDKRFTGLSEQQNRILTLMGEGHSDEEIAHELKLAPSTVRNHRFYMREKEKQARVFLAVMALTENRIPVRQRLIPPHPTAPGLDERYAITEEERTEILAKYMNLDGTMNKFPLKEKRRLVLLRELAGKFNPGIRYSERDVNEVLKPIYHDHVLLRRCLIDYGLLDRLPDGSAYWVKK